MFLLTRAGVPEHEPPVPHLLVEQLWRSPSTVGELRLARGAPAAGWEEAEHYLVVPSLGRPAMLLPDVSRRALGAAVRNYRGLRPARARVQRTVLAAAVTSFLPLGLPHLSIQVRTGAPRPELPLDRIREALGESDVQASIGVRRGANRKATLQLVDTAGTPRGFAKVAWDATSAAGVLRERAALGRVGRTGLARAPEVLATGSVAGHPFLVTAPLPYDVRALRGSSPPPSAVELGALCPITGRAPLGRTGQLGALRERLGRLPDTPETAEVLSLARAVVDRLSACDTWVPVTAYWHGDLTPWNCARTTDGVLWAWDWESSEEESAAGLDAYHWWWSVRCESGERLGRETLRRLAADADPLLVALGVPRTCRALVGALWAATIAERACSLAAVREGWDPGWVLPWELHGLLCGAVEISPELHADGGRR